MTPQDFLKEYKDLLNRTLELEQKVVSVLGKAVDNLNAERKKFEDHNNRTWIEKHKTVLLGSLPIAALLIIFIGAFIFVSSGHTINVRAGDYQVEAR